MATLEELIDELESLTPQSVDELARFVRYLKWKQGPTQAKASSYLECVLGRGESIDEA